MVSDLSHSKVKRFIAALLLSSTALVMSSCSESALVVESASVSFGDVPLGTAPAEFVYRRYDSGRVEVDQPKVNASFKISEPVDTKDGIAEAFLIFSLKASDGSELARLRSLCKVTNQSITCTNGTILGEVPESLVDFDGQLTVTLEGVMRGDKPTTVELLSQPFQVRLLSGQMKADELRKQEAQEQKPQNPDELPAESPAS